MFGRSFGSDNQAGVHPEVMEALLRANSGYAVGYGDDPYTAQAVAREIGLPIDWALLHTNPNTKAAYLTVAHEAMT